jgi:HSP20 family protein
MLNTLFTNDVRQTVDQFRRSVDQMFENFYGYDAQQQPATSPGNRGRTWSFSPMLESVWQENYLHLRAILPGVNQNDVQVTVQNNQLVIEGERRIPESFTKDGAANNAFTQLAYGRFYTALTLPAGLDVEHVNCIFRDGILDIQIPIAEASKPKQIRIQAGSTEQSGERKTISA